MAVANFSRQAGLVWPFNYKERDSRLPAAARVMTDSKPQHTLLILHDIPTQHHPLATGRANVGVINTIEAISLNWDWIIQRVICEIEYNTHTHEQNDEYI